MATYNSSSMTRGTPGRIGIYGTTTVGNIALGNVTLTANDTLPICQIPYGCFIKSAIINIPIVNPSGTTLAISLQDTLASPTVYINASTLGSNFSAAAQFTTATFTLATFGTQYGSTAQALGASGTQVVVWAATNWASGYAPGVGLILKVTATASAATGGALNIPYLIEFAPNYDAGV